MPVMSPNEFRSAKWGTLEFIPAKDNPCHKCLLYNELNECVCAPCTPAERQDGLAGYYSIHQMP